MAAVRKEVVDTAYKLRIAFSDLKATGAEVAALTVGVGGLPLSEAAAGVSRGARRATAVASKILGAAQAAEAAAGKAAAAVTAAEQAKAAAAEAEAAAAKAVAVATQKAKAAAVAAAALEVEKEPPSPPDHMHESRCGCKLVGSDADGFDNLFHQLHLLFLDV